MGKSTRWILGFFGMKRSSKAPKEDCSLDECAREFNMRAPKEKRRWNFGRRKASPRAYGTDDSLVESGLSQTQRFGSIDMEEEQSKHAMAVAAASAVAAEAALAAANAAATVALLTGNGFQRYGTSSNDREWAAIKVQTAFRSYLARRALRALKGVVRLQALFRGHQVRKQAAMTLKCMQALVKVQARIRARRVRNSEEGQAVQRQLSQRRRRQQARPRKSMEGWNTSSGTIEDLRGKVDQKQQAVLKREKALAYALTHQSDMPQWGWSWLERWMTARPWDSPVAEDLKGGKGTITTERSSEESASILEPASARHSLRSKTRMGSTTESFSLDPNTSSSASTAIHTWPSPPVESFRSMDRSPNHRVAINQRANFTTPVLCSASTPSLSGRSTSSRSGFPARVPSSGGYALNKSHVREQEECDSSSADSSPAFSSGPPYARNAGFFGLPGIEQKENLLQGCAFFPNYMTATKSAKAKVRSYSAPKQRPGSSEKPSSASGKTRYFIPWTDKLSKTTRAEGASQFQRSVSQARTRNKISDASEALYNWSVNSFRDDCRAWSVCTRTGSDLPMPF
ncbi:hypothetical protein O6H91_13G007400 [Diphasiastrum complanatum]|uniref:Uncharacterized protein n=1 Tax=Diphasiastrum complanatum TaxID=34168 RepID=A0ACC2BRY0_DIPCM|nr:hypothetical protein O6H91_13G007400 [Diphasiastrum complanatum]